MIKYDRQLNSEIRRTVANFNAKVRRLEKQERELIPNTTSVEELKNAYTKRYELKRKLRELQRFSERGVEDVVQAEKGLRFTKWELDNLKREIRRANYVGNREARRLEEKITPLTITRKSAYNSLKAKLKVINKPLSTASKSELNRIQANINRLLDYDLKTEQFQANFFKILYAEAGVSGTPDYVLSGIQDQLSKLSADDLLKLTKESPEIQAIVDYSPTKGNIISQSRMRDILSSLNEKLPAILSQ